MKIKHSPKEIVHRSGRKIVEWLQNSKAKKKTLVHVDIWLTTYLTYVDNRGHWTDQLPTSSCPRSLWTTPYPKIFLESQWQIMCGSNFSGSDVSCVVSWRRRHIMGWKILRKIILISIYVPAKFFSNFHSHVIDGPYCISKLLQLTMI